MSEKKEIKPKYKVMKTYMFIVSSYSYRWITVYKDHSISIGSEQRFDAAPSPLRVLK